MRRLEFKRVDLTSVLVQFEPALKDATVALHYFIMPARSLMNVSTRTYPARGRVEGTRHPHLLVVAIDLRMASPALLGIGEGILSADWAPAGRSDFVYHVSPAAPSTSSNNTIVPRRFKPFSIVLIVNPVLQLNFRAKYQLCEVLSLNRRSVLNHHFRRLERADARNTLACASARGRRYGFDAQYRWLAGGYAIWAGHWTHLTQGIGIGISGEVTPRSVQQVSRYFRCEAGCSDRLYL